MGKLLGSALLGGGVAAPGAPTVSSAATSTSNIRTTVTNIDPTATTLKIYRSTDNVSFSLIDTVAVTGTSQNYDDATGTAGTNYWYKVGANNAGGEGLSTSSKANTLTYQLISYWKLDETSGTRYDSVGSNNLSVNGTGGVGSGTGVLSNAAAFVGANQQYLSIADNASLNIGNNSFEFCFWINPSSSLGGGVDVLQKRSDYTVIATSTLVQLAVWVGAAVKTVNKTATMSTDTWHFVSVAFDKDAQLISADVNNTGTRPTAATSGSTIDDTSGAFVLGARQGSSYLTGLMEEVGFWKGRTLTATERTALRNGGSGFNGFLP